MCAQYYNIILQAFSQVHNYMYGVFHIGAIEEYIHQKFPPDHPARYSKLVRFALPQERDTQANPAVTIRIPTLSFKARPMQRKY